MDIKGRRVWQIGAGDGERVYNDMLLDWDIVAVGDGSYGRWPDCVESYREDYGDRSVTTLERLTTGMQAGDIVVLRLGKSSVFGLGIVEGDYAWYDDLGDVDGWALQHCRRVRWVWKYDGKQPKMFPENTLKFGDTVQQTDSPGLLEWIREVSCSQEQMVRPLVVLPSTCIDGQPLPPLSLDQISQFLYDRGVAADNIDALTTRMTDLVRIASWYGRSAEHPAERETVAYLAVPLLRSLGWTPQRMAIEWNRIDIALFDALPRSDSNLVVAVEAKRRNRTCFTSHTQVFGYAREPARERCTRAISTEGLRYSAFGRNGNGDFEPRPHAYLNLTRLISNYPLLGCAGAKEALSLMGADWSTPAQAAKAAGGVL